MKNISRIVNPSSIYDAIEDIEKFEDLNIRVPHRYSQNEKSQFHKKELIVDKDKKLFLYDTQGKSEAKVRRSLEQLKALVDQTKKIPGHSTSISEESESSASEKINLLKCVKFGDWISSNSWQNEIPKVLKEAINVDWLSLAKDSSDQRYHGVFNFGKKIGFMSSNRDENYAFKSAKGPAGWIRKNIREARVFADHEALLAHVFDSGMNDDTKLELVKSVLAHQKTVTIVDDNISDFLQSNDLTIEE